MYPTPCLTESLVTRKRKKIRPANKGGQVRSDVGDYVLQTTCVPTEPVLGNTRAAPTEPTAHAPTGEAAAAMAL